MTGVKFGYYVTWLTYLHLISNSHLQSCGETELTGQDGVLTSPNYPNPYPENLSCTWDINPEIDLAAIVVVTHLDMESDENCTNGALTITSSTDYKKSCKERPSPTMATSEAAIRISFVAGANAHDRKGFRLIFSVRNKGACEGYDLSCLDGRACYNINDVCDSLYKCPDHSDEINCMNCGKNEAPCNADTGICFDPLKERCNGVLHCPKGEDEMDCLGRCRGIQCRNGLGCYTPAQICNRKSDCSDNSDEVNCTRRICGEAPSGTKYFLCANQRCIDAKLMANGVDDCGDFSDEAKLKRNANYVPLAIFATISLTMLFLVLLCRWHATRRDVRFLMADLPQFPLPPGRSRNCFDYWGYNIQFSDSDYLRGGEIYEAFVQTRHRLRQERQRRINTSTVQTSTEDRCPQYNSSCAVAALASLGISSEARLHLNKVECFGECQEPCKVRSE